MPFLLLKGKTVEVLFEIDLNCFPVQVTCNTSLLYHLCNPACPGYCGALPWQYMANQATLDLPDEVLAAVLARVPLGKPKVAMQAVSKQWQRVLQIRSAHSLETWTEDDGMPATPNMVSPEGTFRVAKGLLDALVCYRVLEPSDILAVPVQLEALYIERTASACSVLPHLKEFDCPSVAHPLSLVFPHLEVIDFQCRSVDRQVAEVMQDLENIPSLQNVRVNSPFLVDFHGPAGCGVDIGFLMFPSLDKYNIPAGLASHLVRARVYCAPLTAEGAISGEYDLANFSNCTHLDSIVLELGERCWWDHAHIKGIDKVPVSCI